MIVDKENIEISRKRHLNRFHENFIINISWDQFGDALEENIIDLCIMDFDLKNTFINPIIIDRISHNGFFCKTDVISKIGSLTAKDYSIIFKSFGSLVKNTSLGPIYLIDHIPKQNEVNNIFDRNATFNHKEIKMKSGAKILFLELKKKNFNELEFLEIEIITYTTKLKTTKLTYTKTLNEFQDGNIFCIGVLDGEEDLDYFTKAIFKPIFLYYESIKHFKKTFNSVNKIIEKTTENITNPNILKKFFYLIKNKYLDKWSE